MFEIGAIVGRLQLKKDQWDQSIRKVKDDQKSLSGLVVRNSQQFRKMGMAMTVAGGAIIGSFGMMVKGAVGLNKEMANVATLIPDQDARIRELKKNVQDMAMVYGKSTADIAGGLYQVISAFGDAADTSEKLEINVMAAAAGMATTTDAINLTSAVTKGYGDITAKAVQKAADLAFITVKLGQTTFPELAASIGRVVPNAAKLKVSQEELYAVFATLTGVTGNAAEVSTQFAGILRGLMKPTATMTKAIEDLGYESAEAMVEELGLVEALRKLMATTDGTAKQAAKLYMRTEALTAIFALTGEQADTFDEKLAAMDDRIGTLAEAFKQISEGINKAGFDMERLKMMVIVLSQRLGDKLAPMIGKIVVGVGNAVKIISEWIKKHPKLTEYIAKSALAVGALLAIMGPFVMMLPGLVIILPKIAAGFMMMLGPIGLVSAAIVATGIAINTLINIHKKKLDKEMDMMVKASRGAAEFHAFRRQLIEDEIVTVEEWGEIYEKHGRDYKRVMVAISKLPEYAHIRKRWEEMQEEQKKTGESTVDLAKKFEENLANALKKVTEKQKTWIDYLKEIGIKTIKEKSDRVVELEGYLEDLHKAYKDGKIGLEDYKEAVKTLIEEKKELSETIVESVLPAARDMTGALEKAVPAFEGVALASKEASEEIKPHWTTALSGLSLVFRTLSDDFDGVMGDLLSSSASAADAVSNYLKGLEEGFPATFKGILNTVGPMLGQIGGSIGEMISGAKKSFKGLGASVGAIIGSVIPGIGTAIGSLIGGIFGGLFKKTDKAAEKAKKEARELEMQIRGTINSLSKYGDVSESTAEKITELSKKIGKSAAVSKLFADVIKDVGIDQENINKLWKRAADILDDYNKKKLSAIDAAQSLDESFGLLVAAAQEFGEEGSKAMVDFILEVRESGLEVQSVTNYIVEQLDRIPDALEGLIAPAEAAGDALELLMGKLAEQNEELKGLEEGTDAYNDLVIAIAETKIEINAASRAYGQFGDDVERAGILALATFNAMIDSGVSWTDTVAKMKDPLIALRDQYDALGLDANAALEELFGIIDVTEAHGELFEAIDANKTIMEALANSGWLTQDALNAVAADAGTFYDNLIAAGLTSEETYRALTPTLQQIVNSAHAYGLEIDDNTQRLIDEAMAAGLVTEPQEEQRIILRDIRDILREMKDFLRGDMRRAVDETGGRFRDWGGSISNAMNEGQQAASNAMNSIQGYIGNVEGAIRRGNWNIPITGGGGGYAGGFQHGGVIEAGPRQPTLLMFGEGEKRERAVISHTGEGLEGGGGISVKADWNIENLSVRNDEDLERIEEAFRRNVDGLSEKVAGHLRRFS